MGHGLAGDELAQPGAAGLTGLGADAQLFLRAGHGVVGVVTRRVVTLATGVVVAGVSGGAVGRAVGVVPAGDTGARGLRGGVLGRAAGVDDAVVAVEVGLVALAELGARVVVGGVLDQVLVERHGDDVAGHGRLGQGDQGDVGAEQARLDGDPLGLAGGVVEVDLVDLADLLAVAAGDGGAEQGFGGEVLSHGGSFRVSGA
jgi:hypothetical protein